jgi:DNA-directed RNA polymerase subunit K/omega
MSALKGKAVKPKIDSDDEEESGIDEEQNPEYSEEEAEDEDEDNEEDLGDEETPEDVDEEYDEYDLDIAANVELSRKEEPVDLGIMSELDTHEDDESMLVSNDALNIHTSPYLTKYELTKVLALRAQQILTSAPPTVPASAFPDNTYPVDPYTIALMELKMSRLPLIIGRRLPNNTIIRIPVHALLIPE